jgi:hypothetical protein
VCWRSDWACLSGRIELIGERQHLGYGLDYDEVLLAQSGEEFGHRSECRRWWDYAIILAAVGVFIWLGAKAVVPPLAMNFKWVAVLGALLLASLIGCGYHLFKQTGFS